MLDTRPILAGVAASALLLACSLFSLPTARPTPDQTSPAAGATAPAGATAIETASPPPPTAAPTTATGTVTGQVCYPSQFIPALNLYFQDVNTGQVVTVSHSEGARQTYSHDLPPGTYYAYAWRTDTALGGSYSHAVPCGLTTSCTDHSLLSFTVNPGSTSSDIDICDWYGGQGSVPTPPGN